MAATYELRNMCPPWMSALNRAVALGLTGFPFGSAALLKAAIVALYTGTAVAAVNKPTPRRIAVDVDNEINKYISVGVVPSAVFGAASIAAARTAIQALYVANGGSGVLSANHAGSHLGD
jgi:hypothetical protein